MNKPGIVEADCGARNPVSIDYTLIREVPTIARFGIDIRIGIITVQPAAVFTRPAIGVGVYAVDAIAVVVDHIAQKVARIGVKLRVCIITVRPSVRIGRPAVGVGIQAIDAIAVLVEVVAISVLRPHKHEGVGVVAVIAAAFEDKETIAVVVRLGARVHLGCLPAHPPTITPTAHT